MEDIYPNAVVKLLNYNWDLKTTITPTQVIEHTAVSGALSLFSLFEARRVDPNPSKRTFSHVYINLLGIFEQYAPFNKKSAAQWDGNLHGISVETADGGIANYKMPSGRMSLPPLNEAQLETYLEYLRWAEAQGIPSVVCPTDQSAGLGYHSLFHSWNQSDHSCPDPAKIDQFWNVILPALQSPPPDPNPDPEPEPILIVEEQDMELFDGVVNCFKYVLLREPDPAGLGAWLADAQNKVDSKVGAGCLLPQAVSQAIQELASFFATLPAGS